MLILFFSAWFYLPLKPKKLNILIISTCSLKANRLGYVGGIKNTPNIDEIAKKSFVFKNAFTNKSWSNVAGFLQFIPAAFIKKNGYTAIGDAEENNIDLKSSRELGVDFYLKLPGFAHTTINGIDVPDDFSEAVVKIKKRLEDPSHFPFYIEIHNKILHLPYGSAFDKSHQPVRYLVSSSSVEYIREYEKNYLNYPDRLPFSFFLGNIDKNHISQVFKELNIDKIQADKISANNNIPLFIGSLNNKSIIDKWKSSPFFKRDLDIVKEIYDYRLHLFDTSLKDVINLYGDKKLLDNTVVIFTGDHGEAFFEHGLMIHGESVFDEMLQFPLFVKFPGQQKGLKIDQQFFQEGIAALVKKIMSGELNQDNFVNQINKKFSYPFIFSRTCSNDLRSIRYKNKWKYIIDLKRDKKYLFDLKNDPHEMHDIFDLRPDITSFMDENNIASVTESGKNNIYHYCNDE